MKAIPYTGGKITKAGLYSGVPIETYHGDLCDSPSISKSGAWTFFEESAADYYDTSYLNPDRQIVPESEAFALGRGAHHLLLGEADFGKHFIVQPPTYPDSKTGQPKPWHNGAGYCKDWNAAQVDLKRTILTAANIEAIRGMSKTLAADPLVQAGILNGLIEHTMVWRDVETGVWLKVRPDAIPTDDLEFSDFKTAASVRDEDIDRAIGDFGYNVQAAMIGMACRQILGREMASFSLVFAQKKRPYSVRVKTLTAIDLEQGEQQARLAIRMFAKCLKTGVWPGPGGLTTDAQYAEMTPWRRKQNEHRLLTLQAELDQ